MKSLIKYLAILILPIIATTGCKIDESVPVLAGSNDSRMFFREFRPALTLSFDSTMDFKYGEDSIDIDLDNKYDLIVKQRLLFDMNIEERSHYTFENYPFTRLYPKNGLEVALKKTQNIMGRGETQEAFYVDTLNLDTHIENIGDWSQSDRNTSMWYVSPSGYQSSFGCWFYIENEIKYIGIRMKKNGRYKYGWIKVNCKLPENIQIESYAIEN